MKKIILFFLCGFIAGKVIAQQNFDDSIARSRNSIAKNAMVTLGSWAVANIASGFIIAGNTNGEAKYAWLMNGYWNFINLGLAGLGYAGIRKAVSKQYNFYDNYKAQHAIEKLYVFNSGLDLAYIAGGFYLRERGKTETNADKRNKLKGYGTSIVIQGGFLLLMDAVIFTLHHKNTNRMDAKLQQLEIRTGAGGLGISYIF